MWCGVAISSQACIYLASVLRWSRWNRKPVQPYYKYLTKQGISRKRRCCWCRTTTVKWSVWSAQSCLRSCWSCEIWSPLRSLSKLLTRTTTTQHRKRVKLEWLKQWSHHPNCFVGLFCCCSGNDYDCICFTPVTLPNLMAIRGNNVLKPFLI